MTRTGDVGALLLLSHRQSVRNAANLFTGWSDARLSELGVAQARRAAATLREVGVRPTSVHTSPAAAVVTADIVTDLLGCGWIPVHRSWRLDERHYGAAMYADERYADLAHQVRPRTESPADSWTRMLPYRSDVLFPQVLSGETPLVVGHGNSLRAVVLHPKGLRPAQVERLDIPTAMPMRNQLGRLRNPIVERGGRYLDPTGASEQVRISPPQGPDSEASD